MRGEAYLMGYRDRLRAISALEDALAEAALGPDTDRKRWEVGRMEAERDRRRAEAEDFRRELIAFLEGLEGPDETRKRRYQTALRLYYCEGLSWGQVRRRLRPLTMRAGRAVSGEDGRRGVSESAMFRIRQEALAQADAALAASGRPRRYPR